MPPRLTKLTGIILASQLALVHAHVYPYFPAGDMQTTGKTCHIAWVGDKDSKAAWKDMSIEFMTGDNFNMVHLTTVATGRDGTVDGSFDWICPEVTINAAIYFYQFRSPHSIYSEYTTRFPIASSSNVIVPPPESTQSNGIGIPWGKGALSDPSQARPPPVFTTTTTKKPTATQPPTSTSTPKNVADHVGPGCTSFYTYTNLLCYQIADSFNITVANFESWNGGRGICNVLEPGRSYCVASKHSNISSRAISSCTNYFTYTGMLCWQIADRFDITIAQFESWNGGSGICNILEKGMSYCVAAPNTPTATMRAVTTPTNVAKGVVSGCTKFYTRMNLLCYDITAAYSITVAQFESWNGSGVCNALVEGKAYCVAHS